MARFATRWVTFCPADRRAQHTPSGATYSFYAAMPPLLKQIARKRTLRPRAPLTASDPSDPRDIQEMDMLVILAEDIVDQLLF